MKKVYIFLLLISFIFGDQKVCLNMIVKDESKVIERCLESVKNFIDYWVIVDTGSTDGTQEIIKKYMKDIPGELHEKPWVDFAHNRNEALQLAKGKGDYLFFIDADDVLSISPEFSRPELTADGYYININYNSIEYSRLQLVKTAHDWYWDGVVHEVLVSKEPAVNQTLEGLAIRVIGGGDRSSDPEKYLKDAQVLEKALEKDPLNGRNTFYLAQSYRDAEKPELALKFYQKRVDLGGWDQEVFWSLFQIAKLQENLNYPKEDVIQAYTKAIQYRPSRSEPLYHLAEYYRNHEDFFLGYLVSKHGLNIAQSKDVLFVESWVYEYGLLLEYSICAYWAGYFHEAFEACIQMLSNPNLPQHIKECVERNLKFTVEKLPQSVNQGSLQ